MKIQGITTLFVEKKVIKNPVDNTQKESTFFKTSVSSKEGDNYLNASIEIKFNSQNFKPEVLAQLKENVAYKLNIIDGFLSVRKFVNKEGKEQRVIYILVNEAKLEGSKEVAQKPSSEMPF